ncbi:MAG: lipase maturation factor family protein [Gammaproteobacteria bacterium]|nr:lipase maturation factor family protein [Gammaproteobacteria bacterium]
MEKIPVLIYDGDCGICLYWVNYWHKLTGDKVIYHPYQKVAADYPSIPLEEFRRSIQLITIDGAVYKGAEAVYVLLKDIPPYGLLNRLYKYAPGFSLLSESGYTFFSRHRGILRWMSYLFWGRQYEPPRYELISWLFIRLLGCIYLAAFVSLGVQITGLIGSNGILPLDLYLESVKQHFGNNAYLKVPTIFWFYLNDQLLILTCVAGSVISLLLIFNILLRTSLVVLYILYLSLYYAGQTFMTFQWDLLLLEVGFLALFLPARSNIIIWLYRWLAFRFMFLGGVVKIASRDPSWDNLTALTYHFETQPLPTPLAWYVHHLPEPFHITLAAVTLIIELIIPFLIFLPRKLRFIAAFFFMGFQLMIILTGNYNFFNLLTIAFCLFLFDDAAIKWLLPVILKKQISSPIPKPRLPVMNTIVATVITTVILTINSAQFWRIFTYSSMPIAANISYAFRPLQITSVYGPFSVMTTRRLEIIVEGSIDKKTWHEYKFKYKPDDLYRPPGWNIPHQPRLDWQMWFAALGDRSENPWFGNFLYQLLNDRKVVTQLLQKNPFPDHPPVFIRALVYEYHFADPETHKKTGQWWLRELTGMYYPVIKLKGDLQSTP